MIALMARNGRYARAVDETGVKELPAAIAIALARLLEIAVRDGAIAVVIFGSMARGDPDERSDVDVLVVAPDEGRRRNVREACEAHSAGSINALVMTEESLVAESAAYPSFVAHLLDEGRVLSASSRWPLLFADLSNAASDKQAIEAEVIRRARSLGPFSNAQYFLDSPITVFAHLYAIARSLVIARLLAHEIHEYRWRHAFDAYAQVRPDLRVDLEAVKRLRPYYEYVQARTDVEPNGNIDSARVRALVTSVAHLAL
jgi:hypothetical protein